MVYFGLSFSSFKMIIILICFYNMLLQFHSVTVKNKSSRKIEGTSASKVLWEL